MFFYWMLWSRITRLVQLELEHVENVKKCLKKRQTSYSGSKGRNPEQDQVRMEVEHMEDNRKID